MQEVALALIVTLPVSVFVFYGIQLQGLWVIFWLVSSHFAWASCALAYGGAVIATKLAPCTHTRTKHTTRHRLPQVYFLTLVNGIGELRLSCFAPVPAMTCPVRQQTQPVRA